MAGPVTWHHLPTIDVIGNQSITAGTETAIATLSNLNSRGVGIPFKLLGTATFAVSALTTAVTLRIRPDSISGTALATSIVTGGVAGDITNGSGVIVAEDLFAGEYAGKSYLLTIQDTNAGASWNVLNASLRAIN